MDRGSDALLTAAARFDASSDLSDLAPHPLRHRHGGEGGGDEDGAIPSGHSGAAVHKRCWCFRRAEVRASFARALQRVRTQLDFAHSYRVASSSSGGAADVLRDMRQGAVGGEWTRLDLDALTSAMRHHPCVDCVAVCFCGGGAERARGKDVARAHRTAYIVGGTGYARSATKLCDLSMVRYSVEVWLLKFAAKYLCCSIVPPSAFHELDALLDVHYT